MIDWKEFKKLIGNKKRKYLSGPNGRYHFVSYNDELKQVTIMNTKASRTLRIYCLECFINDFTYIEMSNETPLFCGSDSDVGVEDLGAEFLRANHGPKYKEVKHELRGFDGEDREGRREKRRKHKG